MNQEIADALNRHATQEAASAFMYFSMSSWFDNKGLSGFSQWCRVEAQGEMSHMTRFFDYINTRGHQVRFDAMEAPPHEWNSVLSVVEEINNQEVKLTGMINDLVHLARSHADNATESFLNTFIMEQIEDEAESSLMLAQIKMVDDNPQGLLMISNNLENRKATTIA